MTDENDENNARLQTDTIVGAALRKCFADGIQAYVVKRGDKHTGLILIIQHIIGDGYRVLMQSRDENGVMGWLAVPGKALTPDYTDIHPIIERAKSRDPDLWVVEIETKDEKIPFEGKIAD